MNAKPKSLILYGSPTKLTKAHKLVTSPDKHPVGINSSPQPEYFVRARVIHCTFETALEKAKPMNGETVLNTVPL